MCRNRSNFESGPPPPSVSADHSSAHYNVTHQLRQLGETRLTYGAEIGNLSEGNSRAGPCVRKSLRRSGEQGA